MKTILLPGSFDRRGEIFLYARQLLEKAGVRPLTVHIGIDEPLFVPDVSNEDVCKETGKELKSVLQRSGRQRAHDLLRSGLVRLVERLYDEGKIDGILSFGGSGDTAAVTSAMRVLPLGVPKVMVSTMTSGNVSTYVDIADITMMPSICNLSSVNKISRVVAGNAVAAVVGMAEMHDGIIKDDAEKKPAVAISMFGLTKPCVDEARHYLEERGYEVIVFNCTGTGGRAMEYFISEGYFDGVLDLTLTEWCDELAGGVLSAGPTRCDAAIINRIPQVVSVGATDMVNFGPISTVPVRYARRNLYKYNNSVTLMRTTAVESAKVGDVLADKWNNAHTRMCVLLPLKGVSTLDTDGEVFNDPDARKALFDAVSERVYNNRVEVDEVDMHINDKEFADLAAQKLIDLINAKRK